MYGIPLAHLAVSPCIYSRDRLNIDHEMMLHVRTTRVGSRDPVISGCIRFDLCKQCGWNRHAFYWRPYISKLRSSATMYHYFLAFTDSGVFIPECKVIWQNCNLNVVGAVATYSPRI